MVPSIVVSTSRRCVVPGVSPVMTMGKVELEALPPLSSSSNLMLKDVTPSTSAAFQVTDMVVVVTVAANSALTPICI